MGFNGALLISKESVGFCCVLSPSPSEVGRQLQHCPRWDREMVLFWEGWTNTSTRKLCTDNVASPVMPQISIPERSPVVGPRNVLEPKSDSFAHRYPIHVYFPLKDTKGL